MNGSFITGTTSTGTQGWYRELKVWLNRKGILNLLYIPMLKDTGYVVFIHIKKN